MNRAWRVYAASNGSHWRGRRPQLGDGSRALHLASICVVVALLPLSLLSFAITRWVLVPCMARLDRGRHRSEDQ